MNRLPGPEFIITEDGPGRYVLFLNHQIVAIAYPWALGMFLVIGARTVEPRFASQSELEAVTQELFKLEFKGRRRRLLEEN